MTGEGFILLSAAAYAVSSVLIKRFSVYENPVVISGYQFMIGGLIMIVVGLAGGGSLHPTSPASALMMLYMALISAVAYTIWGILLKYNPVSRVAVFGWYCHHIFHLIATVTLPCGFDGTHRAPMLCINRCDSLLRVQECRPAVGIGCEYEVAESCICLIGHYASHISVHPFCHDTISIVVE